MSQPRKTINVDAVRTSANNFLANSQPEQADERKGVASLLDHILLNTDNYRGYRHLEAKHGKNLNGDPVVLTLGDTTRRYYN